MQEISQTERLSLLVDLSAIAMLWVGFGFSAQHFREMAMFFVDQASSSSSKFTRHAFDIDSFSEQLNRQGDAGTWRRLKPSEMHPVTQLGDFWERGEQAGRIWL